MTTPAPHGAPPIEYHWEAGPGDAKWLASAAVRAAYRQPRTAISLAAMLVGSALILAAMVLQDFSITSLAGVILVLLVTMVYVPVTTVRKTRKQFALIAFAGARWSTGYGPTSMVVYQQTSAAVLDYSNFTSATRVAGDSVVIRLAHSRLACVLPAELCPPASFDFLAAAIVQSQLR